MLIVIGLMHYYNLPFTDNSGILPTISSIPALQPTMKFKIGLENVRVQATDVTGNVAKCSFSITVKGEFYGFHSTEK